MHQHHGGPSSVPARNWQATGCGDVLHAGAAAPRHDDVVGAGSLSSFTARGTACSSERGSIVSPPPRRAAGSHTAAVACVGAFVSTVIGGRRHR
jgi:hypothetical protein